MRKPLPLLSLVLVLAPACGEAATGSAGGGEGRRFAADLRPLNGTGVRGSAKMSLAGDHLTVDLEASGLEPNRIHEQHIHGLDVVGQDATCPSSSRAEDKDRDGLLELGERAGSWGRSMQALEPFPTVGARGMVDWELTPTVDPRELEPLDRRVIVLRGRSAGPNATGDGEYLPDVPVACGEIRPAKGSSG